VLRFRNLLWPLLGLAAWLGWPRLLPAEADEADASARGCRPVKMLPFLLRKNFVRKGMTDTRVHARSLRWRAETYGSVPGLGLEGYHQSPVSDHVRTTHFMGLPVALHEKVVPELACVERRLRQQCRAPRDSYHPRAIGGVRTVNTYHQGEVSNHLFGIALDIDPDRNPCCHCVEPWPEHPACQKAARSVYERTELPRCWIQTFETFGFYWLGHDQLEDTMHFEFLGDPGRRRR
jgi:hypothetical protein